MTRRELYRMIGAVSIAIGNTTARIGLEPDTQIGQVLAEELVALALAHAPDPARAVKQAGAQGAGVMLVPADGRLVEGPRVEWVAAQGGGVSVVEDRGTGVPAPGWSTAAAILPYAGQWAADGDEGTP